MMVVSKIFNFIKKHLIVFSFAGVVLFAAFFVALNGVGLYDLENKGGDDCNSSTSSDFKGGKITGTTGDWTRKGTKAYKTAKQIFDFWVSKGMSGAQAAGIVGNVAGGEDTTLELKRYEVPGDTSHGGGLYQFTPLTKFLAIAHGDWSVKSQSNAVLKLEPQTVRTYMSSTKGKSPEECASKWEWTYERPAAWAGKQSEGSRRSAARKAYDMFGGAKIKGKNSLLGGAAKGAASSVDSGDSDCDDYGDGGAVHGDIAKTAKKYIGWFTYEQVHGESYIGSVKHPNKNGKTDCSGFVWFVLAKAGYKVPANMQWYTKTMEEDARGAHKWLKQISAKNSRAGDIIIANQGSGGGDDGHTAILLEKFHGAGTKIIQEGGEGGNGGVNIGHYGPSFGYLTSGTITIARAIKK